MTWDDTLAEMGVYMEVLFCLNTRVEKEIWQYIVGMGAHLEYLALATLWVNAGRPPEFPEFEERLTLGRAVYQLERQGILPVTTTSRLRAVARLRNAVTHRHAVSGVAWAGEYEGFNVFSEIEGLRKLVADTNLTIAELSTWLRVHDGGLHQEPT